MMENIFALVILAVICSVSSVLVFVTALFAENWIWSAIIFGISIVSMVAFILQFIKVEKEDN